MNGNQANEFYCAVRRFLTEEWGRSCAGPWWEGGLQLDFGCSLMRSLGSGLVKLSPASFLDAWPQPIMTRRLAALNHAPGAGRGVYPDFKYWPPDTDKCWKIELKLWSVDGNRTLGIQVRDCVRGFEADAAKVLNDRDEHFGFVLLAVNIPNSFVVRRRQRPYAPDDFKEALIKRICASEPLKQLAAGPGGNRGDWCVAIKKINGENVERVEVYSSVPDLVLSPCP
jgi:hypothetical protein